MNDNFKVILQTAEALATDYGSEGWTGDCCDFTQASSSISQQLTNTEVEQLWDAFANEELIANGVSFLFYRKGRDKTITVKNCPS